MAKLVDARDLKSLGVIRTGSTPVVRTTHSTHRKLLAAARALLALVSSIRPALPMSMLPHFREIAVEREDGLRRQLIGILPRAHEVGGVCGLTAAAGLPSFATTEFDDAKVSLIPARRRSERRGELIVSGHRHSEARLRRRIGVGACL